ncbi:MAG: hypothetical protein AAF402_00710 [Pseudomonadota bacterium]
MENYACRKGTNSRSVNQLRRRVSQSFWITPVVTAVSLPAHAVTSANCPQFFESTHWYETDPQDAPLSVFGEIRIQLTLVNDTPNNFQVMNDFQLWTVPGVIVPPEFSVIANDITVGLVAPGETINYDLTVDVSGLPDSETGLGFRGTDGDIYGNIRPNIASIVSSGNSCI